MMERAALVRRRWRASGVPMKREPANEEWRARTFGVTDPFGNTIFVIGPVRVQA